MSSSDVHTKTKRLPPWMSSPGAPPRPDRATFSAKLSKLIEEKAKCYDEIKVLQESMNGTKTSENIEERKVLEKKLSDIDGELRTQNTLRVGKNTEITKLRQQSREATKELKALRDELGGLSSVKEIDMAIELVMRKMETSGGGLQAEKKTLKRLQQLEDAKGLLFKMQTLSEKIQDAEEREALLQQEHHEIYQRIGALTKELETHIQEKREKTKVSQGTASVRKDLYEKMTEIRARIAAINGEIRELRTEHNKSEEAWDAWCNEAREKYNAKIEAQNAERKQRQQERLKSLKQQRILNRIKERQLQYEVELTACDTLVNYLREKKRITRQEQEEQAKRKAAENFDSAKAAPQGFIVLNEGKWSSKKPLSKAAKKQQNTNKSTKATEPKTLQHPKNMTDLFAKIRVEPPQSFDDIDDCVNTIIEKKKEFETHIRSNAELSSEEEQDEQENDQPEEMKQEDSRQAANPDPDASLGAARENEVAIAA